MVEDLLAEGAHMKAEDSHFGCVLSDQTCY